MMHVEGLGHAGVGSSGPPRQMLIIGGTGDLSRRHLLPALTRLLANRELPEAFELVLTGIEPLSVEACRELLGNELAAHGGDLPADARRSLGARISYLQADARDADSLCNIKPLQPTLIYVATPPGAVSAALETIVRAEIHRSARLVLDKPFGLNRASAQALNRQILDLFDEGAVYRVDHFLYHQLVQDLIRWRVQSDPFSLVDLIPVGEVEIVWDETRAARSGQLPDSGVVRDMIQSHLLQLTAVITMDSPGSLTHTELARHRLEALRRIASTADAEPGLRGRHREDETNTSAQKGEPETFATVTLYSQMPRWKNVRFVLRAAKGIAHSRRHIEFHPMLPSQAYARLEVLTGRLVVGAGRSGPALEFPISSDPESASTRLLRAALSGDDTFTLSAEEPEEAWRIVEPILRAWDQTGAPMLTYGVGASVASVVEGGAEPLDA